MEPFIEIAGFSFIAIFLNIFISNFLIDKKKARELYEKLREHQSKIVEAYRKRDVKKLKELQKSLPEVDKIRLEFMRTVQIPMFISIIPAIFILAIVSKLYSGTQVIVKLPFSLRIIEWLHKYTACGLFKASASCTVLSGGELGWIGWYFICSLFFTVLLRAIFGKPY